jgi:demethylmenaquinone methyltransferase/2-methoxy-6-polyprenyl-1,4-benzoquinol methylase
MRQYNKEKPETIQKLFGSIASSYDTTNSILSFSLHRFWNQELVRVVTQDAEPKVYLDLCSGTGEIAIAYLKKQRKRKKVIFLDFCKEMLDFAKQKTEVLSDQHDLSFIEADAQQIPLPKESVSCVSMAYGIRNVKDVTTCIQDVWRVLEPGGTFGILELTRPKNRFLSFGHKLYLNIFLPLAGRFFAKNKEAYSYLCQSIGSFTEPKELEKILETTGFETVYSKPLLGGIATILFGRKPLV